MLKTMKDLCSSFPKVAVQQSSLDNVAATIFNPDHTPAYTQSRRTPEERYGISVDEEALGHHNTMVPDFDKLGPNEKYLINKVLFSPRNLIVIVGGMGVGKSRFVRYLMDEILPNLTHNNTGLANHGPCPIYFDFLDGGNMMMPSEGAASIRAAFVDAFCDRIEAELDRYSFFDMDYEVGTVWDRLLENNTNPFHRDPALDFIVKELRTEEAGHDQLAIDYDRVIASRKSIRRKIIGDQKRRPYYLERVMHFGT